MTNGTVLVIDDYVAGGFMATPSRTITPDSAGTPSNIHGIGLPRRHRYPGDHRRG